MGKVFETIDEKMSSWIGERELFFVSTAPLDSDGLVNCSPKGLDTFRILDPLTVAYADLTGSGIETAAHVQENGRIVFMFCAFHGPPKIVRLHGSASYHKYDSAEFERLKHHFVDQPGIRGIVSAKLTRIADSCGYGVPKFEPVGDREALPKWSINQGDQGVANYIREKNSTSLDGLPGL